MNSINSQTIENRLRKDLLLARKERDVLRTEVLQTLVTALDNSTAVSIIEREGVTEVPRCQISLQDIKDIIEKEITEIHVAMDVFEKSGHSIPMEFKSRQSLLQKYLDYVGEF